MWQLYRATGKEETGVDMVYFALEILEKDGHTVCVGSGEDRVGLVHTTQYRDGDTVVLKTCEKDLHVFVQAGRRGADRRIRSGGGDG